MDHQITALYFSPTGTTGRIVKEVAAALAKAEGAPGSVKVIDITRHGARSAPLTFTAQDIVVFGIPVYAGRVPNVLLRYFDSIAGGGARAASIVLYGNRNYDDALIELRDLMTARGFSVLAAGAFVGEHAFSTVLAAGRPDASDLAAARALAAAFRDRLAADATASEPVDVPGCDPYRPYYVPKDANGAPVHDFRKIKPITSDACIDCKSCADVCPVGSIQRDAPSVVSGICIKCCACIKQCPTGAKSFDDPAFIRHKIELEQQFAARKEPELYF